MRKLAFRSRPKHLISRLFTDVVIGTFRGLDCVFNDLNSSVDHAESNRLKNLNLNHKLSLLLLLSGFALPVHVLGAGDASTALLRSFLAHGVDVGAVVEAAPVSGSDSAIEICETPTPQTQQTDVSEVLRSNLTRDDIGSADESAFTFYRPSSRPAGETLPIVIYLHPDMKDEYWQPDAMDFVALARLAEQQGFILVLPKGKPRSSSSKVVSWESADETRLELLRSAAQFVEQRAGGDAKQVMIMGGERPVNFIANKSPFSKYYLKLNEDESASLLAGTKVLSRRIADSLIEMKVLPNTSTPNPSPAPVPSPTADVPQNDLLTQLEEDRKTAPQGKLKPYTSRKSAPTLPSELVPSAPLATLAPENTPMKRMERELESIRHGGTGRNEPTVRWNECEGGRILGKVMSGTCNPNRQISAAFFEFMNKNFEGCVQKGLNAVYPGERIQSIQIIHDGIDGRATHKGRSLHTFLRAIDIRKLNITVKDASGTVGERLFTHYDKRLNTTFDQKIGLREGTRSKRAFFAKIHAGENVTENIDDAALRAQFDFWLNLRSCWYDKLLEEKPACGYRLGSIGWEDSDHSQHLHLSYGFCPNLRGVCDY